METQLIHQIFEDQAARIPGHIALRYDNQVTTYQELNEKANQLAHYIKNQYNPTVNSLIGIVLERQVDLIVAIIAVLKTGAAYLPLDPSVPSDRLDYVLKDAQVPILITKSDLLVKHPILKSNEHSVICLDTKLEEIRRQNIYNLYIGPTSKQLAYVLYTSGTTGGPKGVMLCHDGLVNLVYALSKIFYVGEGTRLLQFSSIAFDASVSEIWTTLTQGGVLCLPPSSSQLIGFDLVSLIHMYEIDMVGFPPSILATIPEGSVLPVKVMAVWGELSSQAVLDYWCTKVPHLINAYGPTETTVCATSHTYLPGSLAANIGKPIPNTQIHILDEHRNPVNIGEIGEIYIGGVGVAQGYLNKPKLTAEKFVPNPLNNQEIIYKTGDRGKYLPDGSIVYCGRIDNQVKVRGFRIELEEIETALNKLEDVKQSVVIFNNNSGDARLTAFMIPKVQPTEQFNAAVKATLWPSVAEYFIYDDLLYASMTHDLQRNSKYQEAIDGRVNDKIILDVGTGKDAILARLCLEAGAKHVYAVEYLGESYKSAKNLLQQLGLEENITLIHGDATTIELPESVDVVVSEIVGAIGGAEGAAKILKTVKEKFLKSGGLMIPTISKTAIAAVFLPEYLKNNLYFEQTPAHYVERIFEQCGYKFDLRVCIKNFPKDHLCSTKACFEFLDFNHDLKLEDLRKEELYITQDGLIDGFLVWLNLEPSQGITIDILEESYCWLPVYVPVFSSPQEVAKGDRIEVICSWNLCENKTNPDYYLQGTIFRQHRSNIDFEYNLPHFEKKYRSSAFYEKLFDHTELKSATLVKHIREKLGDFLPAYMMPSAYIFMEKFPLTANGKVDRRTLEDKLAYEANKEANYEANHEVNHEVNHEANHEANKEVPFPKDDTIAGKLAVIWKEVLKYKYPINKDDNFFDLGGHSVLLMQVARKVEEVFSIKLPLTALFRYATIASLSQYLQNSYPESGCPQNEENVRHNKRQAHLEALRMKKQS